MPMQTQREPVVMVIFGAGGDLAWRKLVPALYNLFLDNRLPDRFAIVGIARKEMTDEDFRGRLREGVDLFSRSGRVDESTWREFASRLSYCAGDFTAPGSGELLGRRLAELDRLWNTRADRIFYLAIPPNLVEAAARQLCLRLVTLADIFSKPQMYLSAIQNHCLHYATVKTSSTSGT